MSLKAASPNEDVAVVIPFFNRAAYARRLIQSVLDQSRKPSSVYFVDNGSRPEELDSLRHAVASTKWGNIKVSITSTPKGGNANIARNFGTSMASERYIAYLDSDDWWEPHHLEVSLYTLKNKDYAGVYGGAIVHSSQIYTNNSADLSEFETPFHFLFHKKNYSAQTSSYVIDSRKTKSVKWDEKLKRHQDYDLFLAVSQCNLGWGFTGHASSNLERNDAISGRAFDFKSMIRFLEKWRASFPRQPLINYIFRQLDACILSNAPQRYYLYYRALLIDENASFKERIFSMRFIREMRLSLSKALKTIGIYGYIKKIISHGRA